MKHTKRYQQKRQQKHQPRHTRHGGSNPKTPEPQYSCQQFGIIQTTPSSSSGAKSFIQLLANERNNWNYLKHLQPPPKV